MAAAARRAEPSSHGFVPQNYSDYDDPGCSREDSEKDPTSLQEQIREEPKEGRRECSPGHNADDVAETVLMNFLRGDVGRLQRCAGILTGGEGALPWCKPLKHAYEKEIVLYAYLQGLDYFSTECVYAPNAYRGHTRALLKDLEAVRPSVVADLVHSGERLAVREDVRMPSQGTCQRCGYLSSQSLCKACTLLEGLNRGLARLAIGKPSRMQKALTDIEKPEAGFPGDSQPSSKAVRTIDF